MFGRNAYPIFHNSVDARVGLGNSRFAGDDQNFHIDDLIRFMGYGRTRLFTLFKRHTGLTPNEYLVRLRIRKAKELVKQRTSDAATVAKAVGFNDPAYFKNVYLHYTGTAF